MNPQLPAPHPAPKYRADAKGDVRKLVQEFRDIINFQIEAADILVFEVEDLPAYDEYNQYLTHVEMARAFKSAMKDYK